MKCIVWTLLLTAGLVSASDPNFDAALKAADVADYPTALDKFEAALTADPNNLRFGSDYRQTVIKVGAYVRCIAFFEELVAANPNLPNALMNFGYAHVDKIPIEGAITQVLLANTALTHFSAALEIEKTWLGHFTRGNSYLYWPAIFGRTPLAIADLEQAIALVKDQKQRAHHVRPWIGLGDAHWRLEDMDKARQVWQEALEKFPDNTDFKARLDKEGDVLDAYFEEYFDPSKRVDTDLSILWATEEKQG